jgi:hypothetical protein
MLTVLLLDSGGKKRERLEGYLPNTDFLAALENRLGRTALVRKKYADAERWYGNVVTRFAQSHSAHGAMFRRAVAHYRATNDHTVLGIRHNVEKIVFPLVTGGVGGRDTLAAEFFDELVKSRQMAGARSARQN